MVWPMHVEIIEVTPRDGLQDARGELTTDEKVELILALSQAGMRKIEFTSFVSPRWMPRMRDADEVATRLRGLPGLIALVPNVVGFERAVRFGVREVTFVVSASPRHQEANLRMSLTSSFNNFLSISNSNTLHSVRLRGAISCAYGSPFPEEVISPEAVADIATTFAELGAEEISLADTVGMGTPRVIGDVTTAVKARVPNIPLALHLHDRFGLGQANVVAGLMSGIEMIEATLGGLGGCPYAPNAPGNLNVELLVDWLQKMGIPTGLNLELLAQIRAKLLKQLDHS